jgi:hypothetical protein
MDTAKQPELRLAWVLAYAGMTFLSLLFSVLSCLFRLSRN